VRSLITYFTVVVNVVAMISLIVGVLLHSGASLGSAAAEKNLNRITAVLATVWIFTVIALAFLLSA
jgi:preprotein translocase subunit SecG